MTEVYTPTAATGTAFSDALNRSRMRLPPSIGQGLTLLSGTSLAQLIPALASPIITHVFRPADVGAFAVVLAIFGVLSPIVCLRYDLAIMLPKDEAQAAHLSALCVAVSAVAAAALVALLAAVRWLAPGTEAAAFAPLLLLMLPAGMVLLALQLVAQNWSLRTHNYAVQARAAVTQALVTIGLQISLGLSLGSSAYALVIGTLLGYAAPVLVYLPVMRAQVVPNLRRHCSRKTTLAAALSYRRFPLYTGPYALLGQLSARSVVLVLALLASATVVGQYAVAQRVMYLPVATLMAAASQIFYSRAARRLEDARMPHMVRTVLTVGPLIVGPLFLLVALYAEPIFRIVFGAEWGQAGRFAALLALPSMVKTLTVWLDRVFDIRARQGLALALEASYAVTSYGVTYLVLRLTADPDFAIGAFCALTVGYLVVWAGCALRVGRFPVRLAGEFVIAVGAVSGLMIVADSALAWSGTAVPLRVGCVVLLAVALSAAGLRVAAVRMHAMERLRGELPAGGT